MEKFVGRNKNVGSMRNRFLDSLVPRSLGMTARQRDTNERFSGSATAKPLSPTTKHVMSSGMNEVRVNVVETTVEINVQWYIKIQ